MKVQLFSQSINNPVYSQSSSYKNQPICFMGMPKYLSKDSSKIENGVGIKIKQFSQKLFKEAFGNIDSIQEVEESFNSFYSKNLVKREKILFSPTGRYVVLPKAIKRFDVLLDSIAQYPEEFEAKLVSLDKKEIENFSYKVKSIKEKLMNTRRGEYFSNRLEIIKNRFGDKIGPLTDKILYGLEK